MPDFRKIILREGLQRPNEHDRVEVIVSAIKDDKFIVKDKVYVFDVGHSEDFGIIKSLDDIVQTMGCNEECQICTSDMSLKIFVCSDAVPADHIGSDILLHIYLKDVQKLAEFWQMSEDEKILVAEVMKRRGNKLMNNKEIVRAFRSYKMAIRILEGSASVLDRSNLLDSDAKHAYTSNEGRKLLSICLANAALCLLQLVSVSTSNKNSGLYSKNIGTLPAGYLVSCIKLCKRAVQLNPDYSKALFRLAKAHAMMGDFSEAIIIGNQCLESLNKKDRTDLRDQNLNGESQDDSAKSMIKQVTNLLNVWRKQEIVEASLERALVRKMTIQHYRSNTAGEIWSDDEDAIEKLPISVWSNDLAKNMMSLHEELEAFGEKMPELNAAHLTRGRNSNKDNHKIKPRLTTIIDKDSDDDFQ